MPSPFVSNQMDAGKLKLVRYAMLAGLLIFGGVAYTQRANAGYEPQDPQTNLEAIGWVGYGLCAAAIVGIAVLRGIRARAEPPARLTWSLIGSALAESAALLGAVIILMGGEIWIYALGLLIFLGTWSLLPADPEEA